MIVDGKEYIKIAVDVRVAPSCAQCALYREGACLADDTDYSCFDTQGLGTFERYAYEEKEIDNG